MIEGSTLIRWKVMVALGTGYKQSFTFYHLLLRGVGKNA